MPRLMMKSGPLAGSELVFDREVVVGRGAMADVAVDHPTISRRHSMLAPAAGGWVITDLRSGNGTRVNGRLIREATPLRSGDAIMLGSVDFEFTTDEPAAEAGSKVEFREDGPAVLQTIGAGSAVSSLLGEATTAEKLAEVTRRLELINEVGAAIAKTFDENELLALILDRLFSIFPNAERGFVLGRDERGELQPKAARTRSGEETPLAVSRTLVRDVVENRRGILSADASRDERFESKATILHYAIRSVVCVPMVVRDEVSGVIQLDGPSGAFSRDDMALLLGIAGQAAVALANVGMHNALLEQELLRQDLALARRIQTRFLPEHPPSVEGFEFCDEYTPALEVGGDYFDFFELPANRIGIAIGDVSGKGVSAALYVAKLSSELRYQAAAGGEPEEILGRVNRALVRDLEEGMFITLIFATLDVTGRRLSIANAGHLDPFVRRANGSVERAGVARTPPIGISAETKFVSSAIAMNAGDVVIMFTDGVNEAMNQKRQLYGDERLAEAIRKAGGGAAGVRDAVVGSVQAFVGSEPQNDDITLVCVAATGARARRGIVSSLRF